MGAARMACTVAGIFKRMGWASPVGTGFAGRGPRLSSARTLSASKIGLDLRGLLLARQITEGGYPKNDVHHHLISVMS